MDNGAAFADAFFDNCIDTACCKAKAKFHIWLQNIKKHVRRKSMVLRQQSLVVSNVIFEYTLLYSCGVPLQLFY